MVNTGLSQGLRGGVQRSAGGHHVVKQHYALGQAGFGMKGKRAPQVALSGVRIQCGLRGGSASSYKQPVLQWDLQHFGDRFGEFKRLVIAAAAQP